MHLRIALFLVLAVAGNASAQSTLRYQFKEGQKLEYSIEQKMKTAASVMGMDVESTVNLMMQLAWNVVKVEKDGDAQVRIKVSQCKLSMDGPTGKIEADSSDKNEPDDQLGKIFSQIARVLGAMEITATMQQTGEMKDVKASEETLKAMKNLPQAGQMAGAMNPDSLKGMISTLVLPREAVTKGKTWSAKIESKTPLGKTIVENAYTYDGPIQKSGGSLEKITLKPTVKIEPEPNGQIGVQVKEAKGAGTILFDNQKGALVESVTSQRLTLTLTIMGMNFDQVVDQTTTMKLKK